MLPTDGEFLTLYIVYFTALVFLIAGAVCSKYRERFKRNLIFYSCYTVIMMLMFTNEKNFTGGSGLTVLFFGGIFILLHLTVFIFSLLGEWSVKETMQIDVYK